MPVPSPRSFWPVVAPVGWLVAALVLMAPDAPTIRAFRWTGQGFLVYDPADLTAYAQRAANAVAGRTAGRPDEPPLAGGRKEFDARLDAPAPPLAPRYYLEYPPPALGLFVLEAAVVGPATLPPAAADARHVDLAFHRPRTPAEEQGWGRLRAFVRLHMVLMAAAGVGLGLVLRAGYAPGLAAGSALWLVALPGACFFTLARFDVLPALLTALAFRAVGRGRLVWAGAWLALGVGLKLYPVLLVPILLRLVGVRAGLRLLGGFAGTLALLAAGSVLSLGADGALTPILVQLGRAPELGGWGAWGLYGRLLPTGLAYSSAGRLGLLAAVVLGCVVSRPADLAAALRRCGLVLVVFTQLAVFWSPQWLVWLLPVAVPLAGREAATKWAAAAVDVTNYLSFPGLFHVGWQVLPAAAPEPLAEALIVLRTFAWGWLGWRFLVGGRVRAGFDLGQVRTAVTPPRGLAWAGIEPAGEPRVTTDRALVPVVVRFEPTPGGGLEDVPQARDPRPAVAVFEPRGGRWVPTGKLAFNLDAERLEGERPV